MKTNDLIQLVRGRGLRFALMPDGRPSLRGPAKLQHEVTPKLLKVLARPEHREEILRRLRSGELN